MLLCEKIRKEQQAQNYYGYDDNNGDQAQVSACFFFCRLVDVVLFICLFVLYGCRFLVFGSVVHFHDSDFRTRSYKIAFRNGSFEAALTSEL